MPKCPKAWPRQVRPGNAVEARTPAFPGEVFKGKVSAILPEVNATTRTLKARIELANPQGELVPGMFATVDFTPPARTVRAGADRSRDSAPASAPSWSLAETGADGASACVRSMSRPAPRANGETEIRTGLQAGQKVVVSGQFLIDSEANLKAVASRFTASAGRARGETRRETSDDRAPHPLVASPTASSCCWRRCSSAAWGVWALISHAARRAARPLRRAGDHPHDLSGPGAADRREPGHLSAHHDHALGAGRQDRARLFVVRRLVRLRAVRGRHRPVLGALAGARIPEPGAERACRRRRKAVARARRHRRRLGLRVRAGRPHRPA